MSVAAHSVAREAAGMVPVMPPMGLPPPPIPIPAYKYFVPNGNSSTYY